MRKRLLSLICTVAVLFTMSLQVFAATSTVTSTIYFSGGGTGYSDSSYQLYNTYLIVPGSNLHYDKYHVKLTSFKFDYYPQDIKPNSDVRFNFRLAKTLGVDSHENCASVIYIYSINGTGTAWLWENGGNSGNKNAMKTNVSNYSSTGCGLTCQWYLYMT